MSAITIYTKSGSKRCDAMISKEAQHVHELMKEHYVQLVFNAPLIEFSVGDYIMHEQEKFTLNELPKPIRNGNAWKYDIRFNSFEANWKNCVMFFIPEIGAKESEWSLTSTPADFMSMAVNNINRFFGTTIQLGTVVPAETKSITFTNVSVWDALSQIAETFASEWWFDGEYLHLNKFEYGSGEELMVNKQIQSASGSKGDDKGYATRIYPYGSTRNIIPETTSTATNSILNNRLKLAGKEYVDSRANLTKEEIVEAVVIFEDIYPRMKDKKITSVRFEEQTIDETKQNVYYFKIANLGFDPKPLILEGMNLSVKFESGNLNGREFELNWNETNQEFEILNVNESGSLIIPNASLCPAINDAVVLFNLKMPESYKAEAQAELLTASLEYILEASKDRTVYTCPTNPVHCSSNNKDYQIGQRVILKGDEFGSGRESRIQRFEKKLYNKYICTYQVGDNAAYSRLNNVEREAREAKYAVTGSVSNGGSSIPVITRYDVSKPTDSNVFSALRTKHELDKRLSKEADDVAKGKIRFEKGVQIGTDVVPGLIGGSIDQDANAEFKSLTLREFLDVPELRKNRVTIIDGDQWSAPGSGIIERVDSVSKVFTLKLEPGEVPSIAVDDICKGIFNLGSGFQTVYFRIVWFQQTGDEWQVEYSLKPGTTLHPQPFMHFVGFGNFTNKSRQASAVRTKTYDMYLSGVNTWDIAADMIKMRIGDMTGIVINGVDLSGYSFYVANGYFSGLLAQLAPAIADSEQNTKDYVDEKTAAENLALQNFIDNTYTQEMLAMQAQLDGQVESFFFQQDPTLTNAPANGWTTTVLKESHLNDTYTNLSTGKSWRWAKNGSTYSWVPIADTATEKALQIAGQAKDTADSKRRTFVVTPSSPYDIGDLWVTSTGELMKCVYPRASGSYMASDWVKATKYTDDSAVENLQIGGRNFVLESEGIFISKTDQQIIDYADKWMVISPDFKVNNGDNITISADFDVTLVTGYTRNDAYVVIYIVYTDGSKQEIKIVATSTIKDRLYTTVIAEKDVSGYELNLAAIRDGMYGSISNIKLEKGNKPTDWSPAPEDTESAIEDAKATAPVLYPRNEYSGSAVYVGNKYRRDVVWVTNASMASGREYFTAKVTAGEFSGMPTTNKDYWETRGANFEMVATDLLLSRRIKADEIETDNLVSAKVSTAKNGARIEIEGSVIRAFGNFCKNIEIGINDQGYAVMTYYSNTGEKLYDLGPKGMDWGSIKPASWASVRMTKVCDIQANDAKPGWSDVQFVKDGITDTTGTFYYNYYAGSNPTITDEERAKEAYLYTSASTTSAKIPDGWYTVSQKEPYWYPSQDTGDFFCPDPDGIYMSFSNNIQDTTPIYHRVIMEYKGGKVLRRISVYWNGVNTGPRYN